jgi:hypothetical protein
VSVLFKISTVLYSNGPKQLVLTIWIPGQFSDAPKLDKLIVFTYKKVQLHQHFWLRIKKPDFCPVFDWSSYKVETVSNKMV